MKTYIRTWIFLCAVPLAILGITEESLWYMLGASILAFIALVGAKQVELPRIEETPTWFMIFTAAILFSLMATWSARNTPTDWFAGILWLMTILGLLLASWLHDSEENKRTNLQDNSPAWHERWSWAEVSTIVLFTIIAFIIRAYQIEILPPLHGDEGEMGELAIQIVEGGEPLPLFVTKWLSHPTLFHYLQAGSIWIGRWFFDQDVTGLRLLSVLFGALCVPAIYSLARQGWGKMAGLTAAWLLTISHTHIQYSRIGLNNIQTVWACILIFALLATAAAIIPFRRAKERDKVRKQLSGDHNTEGIIVDDPEPDNPESDDSGPDDSGPAEPTTEFPYLYMPFIGAGLLLGIAQYFYFGSRLMFIILPLLLIYLWLRKAANIQQILLSVTSFIAVYLPLLLHYLENPVSFTGRADTVSIFSDKQVKHILGPEASWPRDIIQVLWLQLEQNLRFFVDYGDLSPFYYPEIPGFDQVTAVLFWLGLGIVLTKAFRYHEFAMLLWFGTGLLVGGIITNDSPYGARLIVMVPAVFVMAGVFVQAFCNLFSNSYLQLRRVVIGLTFLTIMFTTAWLNMNLYFGEYAKAPPRILSFAIAQEMMIAPEKYDTYLMGAPAFYAEYGTIRFVAKAANAQNLESIDQLLEDQQVEKKSDASGDEKEGLLIIILEANLDQLPQLQEAFPNGTEEVHEDALERYLFTSYRIESIE